MVIQKRNSHSRRFRLQNKLSKENIEKWVFYKKNTTWRVWWKTKETVGNGSRPLLIFIAPSLYNESSCIYLQKGTNILSIMVAPDKCKQYMRVDLIHGSGSPHHKCVAQTHVGVWNISNMDSDLRVYVLCSKVFRYLVHWPLCNSF